MTSPPRTSRPLRKNPLAIGIAAVLLAAAVFVSFWVPIYARSTPKLGAFPFFYWFQLILVPAVAIVSWLAYLLVRSQEGSASAPGASAPAGERTTATEPGTDEGPETAL
jgi:membrane protein implicated in regulation of membrane protease activity